MYIPKMIYSVILCDLASLWNHVIDQFMDIYDTTLTIPHKPNLPKQSWLTLLSTFKCHGHLQTYRVSLIKSFVNCSKQCKYKKSLLKIPHDVWKMEDGWFEIIQLELKFKNI